MRTPIALSIQAVCLVAVATGCRRRDDEQARANAQAERIAQESTVTSGTLDRVDGFDETLRSRAEGLAAFRREELDYRRKLEDEIDALDRRASLETDGARKITSVARRDVLVKDIDAVERSTQQDWPSVKAGLDRDLSIAQGTGR